MTRRRKMRETPHTPTETRPEPGAWGVNTDAVALPANADVRVERAERGGKGERGNVARAARLDVFDLLKRSPAPDAAGAYDAIRRLEHDMLVAAGLGDRGGVLQRVDVEGGRCHIDVAMAARDRFNAAAAQLGPRNRMVLTRLLLEAQGERAGRWRDTVQELTGETNDRAQLAIVRHACGCLAMIYAEGRRHAA